MKGGHNAYTKSIEPRQPAQREQANLNQNYLEYCE